MWQHFISILFHVVHTKYNIARIPKTRQRFNKLFLMFSPLPHHLISLHLSFLVSVSFPARGFVLSVTTVNPAPHGWCGNDKHAAKNQFRRNFKAGYQDAERRLWAAWLPYAYLINDIYLVSILKNDLVFCFKWNSSNISPEIERREEKKCSKMKTTTEIILIKRFRTVHSHALHSNSPRPPSEAQIFNIPSPCETFAFKYINKRWAFTRWT